MLLRVPFFFFFCTILAERTVRLRDTMTKTLVGYRVDTAKRNFESNKFVVDTGVKNQYADDFKNLL